MSRYRWVIPRLETNIKASRLGFHSPPTVRSLSFAVAPWPPGISLIRRVEMAEGKPKIQSGVWSTIKPFVNGGASGMLATCVIQPIDMVKVCRRSSFPSPKAAIGLTAGAIGASVGSPADLALIRMQADATLPAAQRRNYKNAFHALYRIIADEGVLALWKGAGPTVVRAMSLNMGMLASYDQSIELFRDSLGFGEVSTILDCSDATLIFISGASAVSGFFASACSLPFDYVKTQIQKMQPDATGKFPYTGSLDCVMKTLKSGGPFKFYTGFPVYCVRIAPHVMVKALLLLGKIHCSCFVNTLNGLFFWILKRGCFADDLDILESNSEGRAVCWLIKIHLMGN
ncbi:hypothetical protein GW17_00011749 [Ensete ventricosum]|nr:hypothetical protein GW17_00011749 [Ensete ventricosum]